MVPLLPVFSNVCFFLHHLWFILKKTGVQIEKVVIPFEIDGIPFENVIIQKEKDGIQFETFSL